MLEGSSPNAARKSMIAALNFFMFANVHPRAIYPSMHFESIWIDCEYALIASSSCPFCAYAIPSAKLSMAQFLFWSSRKSRYVSFLCSGNAAFGSPSFAPGLSHLIHGTLSKLSSSLGAVPKTLIQRAVQKGLLDATSSCIKFVLQIFVSCGVNAVAGANL